MKIGIAFRKIFTVSLYFLIYKLYKLLLQSIKKFLNMRVLLDLHRFIYFYFTLFHNTKYFVYKTRDNIIFSINKLQI